MKSVFYISIRARKCIAKIIFELFTVLELQPSEWEENNSDFSVVSLFFENKNEMEKVKSFLFRNSAISKQNLEIISGEMKEDEWATVWKKFFHTARVGKNLIIKPPWENYKKQKYDIIIEIDPEMSFGTGLHPTTRACLEFIEEVANEKNGGSFFDVGAGSGVLSIAAAKLGFTKRVAIDNQQNSSIAIDNLSRAQSVSWKNCRLNAVKVNFTMTSIEEFAVEEKFDVVAANMIISILLPNIEKIISAVKPGGYLILSGILEEQYQKIYNEVTKRGLRESDTKIFAGWKSGLFNLITE